MVELGQRVAAFVRVEDRHHERLRLDEDVLVRDPERLAAPLQRRVDLQQQVDEVREVVVLIIASTRLGHTTYGFLDRRRATR